MSVSWNYQGWVESPLTARRGELPRLAPALHPAHQTECAWCSTVISDGILPVSHGICAKCEREHFS